MVDSCMHLEVDGNEILGGLAKLLHNFEACQATLATYVSHNTNEGLLLWYPGRKPKVVIVFPFNAYS